MEQAQEVGASVEENVFLLGLLGLVSILGNLFFELQEMVFGFNFYTNIEWSISALNTRKQTTRIDGFTEISNAFAVIVWKTSR